MTGIPIWHKKGSPAQVPGFRVGHAQAPQGHSGASVVLCPPGTVGGMCVGGAAAGTRQTDALQPGHLVREAHAVLLCGGSAFGLQAAGGAVQWLEERGVGIKAGDFKIPIVPTAVIYDLPLNQGLPHPGPELGWAACQAATDGPMERGNVGAGSGATIGKLFGLPQACKGGLGGASMRVGDLCLGALAVVNCFGDVLDEQGRIMAGARRQPASREFLDTAAWFMSGQERQAFQAVSNTTLVALAVNARLDKTQACQLAARAHHGLARTIDPVHTSFDGDLVITLASGQVEADLNGLSIMAARLTSLAVWDAVRAAASLPDLPAARDLKPQPRQPWGEFA